MKTLTFLFAFVIVGNSFGQKKNDLLKEINLFKTNAINNVKYTTTRDSLTIVLDTYFNKNDYLFYAKTDSSIIFYKTLNCFGERQFLNHKGSSNGNYMRRNLYVSNIFDTTKNQISLKITSTISRNYPSKYEYAQAILSNGTDVFRVNGQTKYCYYKTTRFSFNSSGISNTNSFDIKKYLYVHFYGNVIPFSKKLLDKISTYNSNQINNKNQLIVGRYYQSHIKIKLYLSVILMLNGCIILISFRKKDCRK